MSQSIRKEVMQASQNWINSFNNGDVNACIDRYTSNAFMQVHPLHLKVQNMVQNCSAYKNLVQSTHVL